MNNKNIDFFDSFDNIEIPIDQEPIIIPINNKYNKKTKSELIDIINKKDNEIKELTYLKNRLYDKIYKYKSFISFHEKEYINFFKKSNIEKNNNKL